MDFVVVGFGLGALGVLLGVVMLGWLAPRSRQAAARVVSPDDAARHRALAAERYGTGQAFLYAGGAMFFATVAALMGSLDDRTGAFLVTTTATVAAFGILLVGYLQRVRNPIPARRRTRSAPVTSASIARSSSPDNTPSFLVDEPPWDRERAAAEQSLQGAALATSDSDEEAIIVEEMASLTAGGSGTFSSDATNPGPLDDSSIATASASRQVADQATDNGSDDTDLVETEEVMDARSVAPVTQMAEPTRSRSDDEDPSSGHS